MKKLISVVMALVILLSSVCSVAYAGDTKTLDISKSNISHDVSQNLYGVNLEEISNSFDGGLVSNMINNNSFEYTAKQDFSWTYDGLKANTDNKTPLNPQNTNYQSVSVDGKGTMRNLGYIQSYDGSQKNYNKDKQQKADMYFKKDARYKFACYMRNVDFDGTISVYLDSPSNAHRVNQLNTSALGNKSWTYFYTSLTSIANETGAIAIEFNGTGTLLIDFVTLVDEDSYGYDSENWKYVSLRSDLYNALENLKPSFVRFYPNGLSSDGSLNNLYNWKDTIGPIENRKQNTSIYADDEKGIYYNNSNFMGMHECMQLSKDLGAKPIPAINVGILSDKQSGYQMYSDALNKLNMNDEQWQAYLTSDRNMSSSEIAEYTAEIKALNINSRDDFNNYINKLALSPNSDAFLNYAQDVLDLIEYANGDSKTSYWGALRGSNGSDEPFEIEYVALVSDSFGDIYLRNFEALYNIIKEKYPCIKIIASGCSKDSQAYNTINSKFSDVIIDEHNNYEQDEFYNNSVKYDGYDRQNRPIMISEYGINYIGNDTDASNNSLRSAIEEAAFLTSIEKNSDVVKFLSYSPTMAKINAQNSPSNLIWFNSSNLVLTPNYFVSMLFSNNVGTKYIDTQKISDTIYQSVTIDEETQTIYIKLVNSGGKENINVSFNDFGNINSVSNYCLSNKYASAYNSEDTNYVMPKTGKSIETNGKGFNVALDKNSVNVIRVAYGDNEGNHFYELPDTIDYKTKHYIPHDFKIAMVSIVVLIIILTIGIGIFLKKYEAYKKKNK